MKSVEEIQAGVRGQLSVGARMGYTALGVAGVGMAAIALSLFWTEPVLPIRTQIAFVLIAAGGIAWAGYAAWVLTTRRVLFATHKVRAAELAVGLSALFLIGALILRSRAGVGPIAANALMLAVAMLWLVRARRRLRELTSRLSSLETRNRS